MKLLRVLTVVSISFYFLGLFVPCLKITPSAGGPITDAFFRILGANMDPYSISVFGGIVSLLHSGDYLIGGLIALFSVLFPSAKLALISIYTFGSAGMNQKLAGFLHKVGPWSMLDVFVIGIIVILFKTFPGGTRAQPLAGIFFFSLSVVTTILCTSIIHRSLHSPKTAPINDYEI